MIPITFNGESVYLLHYRADWQAGFDLSLVMPADIDRSQGGIEARAYIDSTNHCTVRLYNPTASPITVGSLTFRALVIEPVAP